MTKQEFDFGGAIGLFFKRLGSRPGATLWVALWNAILMSAFFGALIWMVGPAYLSFFDMALTGQEPEPSEVLTLMGPFLAVIPISFIGGILVALMAQGAWLRLLVRDEVAAGIPLRLGADEGRLLVVNIIYLALGIAVYVAFILLTVIITVALAGSDGGMAAGATAGLLGIAGMLVILLGLLFVGIKLSAAPALTVYDRKIRFFESWGATARIFWWLLLAYLVMLVLILVAQMVLGTMIQFIFLGAFIPLIMEIGQMTDPDSVQAEEWIALVRDQFSNPGTLAILGVGVLLSLFLQTFCEALWHSVGAYTARRYRMPPESASVAAPDAPVPPPAITSEPE